MSKREVQALYQTSARLEVIRSDHTYDHTSKSREREESEGGGGGGGGGAAGRAVGGLREERQKKIPDDFFSLAILIRVSYPEGHFTLRLQIPERIWDDRRSSYTNSPTN